MLLAATFGQDLAEVFPDGGIILLLIFDCRFDQIGEGLDELRSRRVLGCSCLLKCLFCSHLDGRHAFEEHFDEIVARAHLGLVNEASYQRQAFGWSSLVSKARASAAKCLTIAGGISLRRGSIDPNSMSQSSRSCQAFKCES